MLSCGVTCRVQKNFRGNGIRTFTNLILYTPSKRSDPFINFEVKLSDVKVENKLEWIAKTHFLLLSTSRSIKDFSGQQYPRFPKLDTVQSWRKISSLLQLRGQKWSCRIWKDAQPQTQTPVPCRLQHDIRLDLT
jgi:hypothetical protein